jgi:hypothetical protein
MVMSSYLSWKRSGLLNRWSRVRIPLRILWRKQKKKNLMTGLESLLLNLFNQVKLSDMKSNLMPRGSVLLSVAEGGG